MSGESLCLCQFASSSSHSLGLPTTLRNFPQFHIQLIYLFFKMVNLQLYIEQNEVVVAPPLKFFFLRFGRSEIWREEVILIQRPLEQLQTPFEGRFRCTAWAGSKWRGVTSTSNCKTLLCLWLSMFPSTKKLESLHGDPKVVVAMSINPKIVGGRLFLNERP